MKEENKKKFSRRDFLKMSGIAGTGIALVACGQQATEVPEDTSKDEPMEEEVAEAPVPPEPVELSYWVVAGEARAAVYQEGVDRFEEKSGYTVTMEPIPGNDVEVQQKILTSIASGFVPDVVHMDTMFINQVAPTGVLLPLEEFPGAKELTDAIWPGAMEPLILDGHTWAFPIRANSIQFFYDKDVAEESGLDPNSPPVYMEDMVDWASAMTKQNASGVVERFGYDHRVSSNASWSTHAFYPLIWGYMGKMLDDNGMAAFNSEEGVKALDFWANLVKDGYSSEKSIDNGLELGKTGSVVTGEWEIYHLKNEVGLNLGVAPYPYPQGGEHAIPLGGRTLTMYKVNPHPDEAWELLYHIMTKEEQMHITKNLQGLTPRRDVLDDPWWAENPEYQLTLEDMEYVRPKDATPYFLEMVDVMLEAFQKVLLDATPSKQALDESADKFNEIVETGTKQ